MNRSGHEPPTVLERLPVIEGCVDTNPTTGRVSCTNFTIGTYLGFKAMSQCRNPSTVTTPSSGRSSEGSLVMAMEESKDIDGPAWVTAYEGVGMTICNMLNSLCGSWSEGKLSRAVGFLCS